MIDQIDLKDPDSIFELVKQLTEREALKIKLGFFYQKLTSELSSFEMSIYDDDTSYSKGYRAALNNVVSDFEVTFPIVLKND